MWLLNTTTLELRDFVGAEIPPYAILSHTWGEDEVTFKDMLKYRETARQKAGFLKVEKCCEKARQDGLQHAWIDTCCIDKRSSAELSEVINTMYRWYKDAKVCYAYLSDARSEEMLSDAPKYDSLVESTWFTRGWTLQELIAPTYIQFLGQDWRVIGIKASNWLSQTLLIDQRFFSPSKNDAFLSKVAEISGVEETVLRYPHTVQLCPAARKMAWAANRETKREEDLAYALRGLFNVSMPILYGEGLTKAFRRLQLEIIRMTTDQSIFVWRASRESSGLLAACPKDFSDSKLDFVWRRPTLQPYSMTNLGLLVNLPLIKSPDGRGFIAALRCCKSTQFM